MKLEKNKNSKNVKVCFVAINLPFINEKNMNITERDSIPGRVSETMGLFYFTFSTDR